MGNKSFEIAWISRQLTMTVVASRCEVSLNPSYNVAPVIQNEVSSAGLPPLFWIKLFLQKLGLIVEFTSSFWNDVVYTAGIGVPPTPK